MSDLVLRMRGDVVKKIESHAKRLGCDPRQLTIAILTIVFEGDLVDGLLDGDAPGEHCRHYGPGAPRRMRTQTQDQLFTWLESRLKLVKSDRVRLSFDDVSAATGLSRSYTYRVAQALIKRGDIAVGQAGIQGKSIWSIVRRADA